MKLSKQSVQSVDLAQRSTPLEGAAPADPPGAKSLILDLKERRKEEFARVHEPQPKKYARPGRDYYMHASKDAANQRMLGEHKVNASNG